MSSSKLFFVQIKGNPHLFLAESCGSSSGHSCWLTQRQLIAVPFHTTFEPVFACCFFVTANGLGILFWIANWKVSLLTSSRVHPNYFRSINKIFSVIFYSRAGGTIGLHPNFDWVA
jgi:hypothetical protein